MKPIAPGAAGRRVPVSLFAVCGVALAVAVALLAIGAVQFVEFKEYPHICVMADATAATFTQIALHDETPAVAGAGASTETDAHGYALYEFSSTRTNDDEPRRRPTPGRDVTAAHHVFFVHGNAGDHRDGRWVLWELHKLLIAGASNASSAPRQRRPPSPSASPLLPGTVRMFAFAFAEESNIHSGAILRRQTEFVARQVRRICPSSQGRAGCQCVWLVGHSMGGVVARRAADRIAAAADTGVDAPRICGLVTLASPQSRLPLHLDATLTREAEVAAHARPVTTGATRPGRRIGVIMSVSTGAGDLQVYEPMSRLPSRVRAAADVAVQLSTVAMAGAATSHHGVEYCHQLVRPVAKSLVWLIASSGSLGGVGASDLAGGGGDDANHAAATTRRRLIRDCFTGASSPTAMAVAGADADGRAAEDRSAEKWLAELATSNYSACAGGSALGELARAFSAERVVPLVLSTWESVKRPRDRAGGTAGDSDMASSSSSSSEGKAVAATGPVSVAVPWRTARHDVFTTIFERRSGPRFLRAITLALGDSAAQVAAAVTAAEALPRMRRLRFDDAATAARSGGGGGDGDDVIGASTLVVPAAGSRIFLRNAAVSSGADVFWVTAKFAPPGGGTPAAASVTMPHAFPVVVACCGRWRVRFLVGVNEASDVAASTAAAVDFPAFEWIWFPAVGDIVGVADDDDGPAAPGSADADPDPATLACSLMLVSAEPLCVGDGLDQRGSGGGSGSAASPGGCWHVTVDAAPLPMRMMHAMRHCAAAYEVAFGAAALAVAAPVAFALLAATVAGGGSDVAGRSPSPSPWRLAAVSVAVSAAFVLLQVRLRVDGALCDATAQVLATGATLALALVLVAACVVLPLAAAPWVVDAVASLPVLAPRIAMLGTRSGGGGGGVVIISWRFRLAVGLCCTLLSVLYAPFAPLVVLLGSTVLATVRRRLQGRRSALDVSDTDDDTASDSRGRHARHQQEQQRAVAIRVACCVALLGNVANALMLLRNVAVTKRFWSQALTHDASCSAVALALCVGAFLSDGCAAAAVVASCRRAAVVLVAALFACDLVAAVTTSTRHTSVGGDVSQLRWMLVAALAFGGTLPVMRDAIRSLV